MTSHWRAASETSSIAVNMLTFSRDCTFFRGDLPCDPHKREGVRCKCAHFKKRGQRVLIIKLGAVGDVIRTTPIIHKLRADDPQCEITWISKSPEVLPKTINYPMGYTPTSLATLLADEFDLVLSLDKDREACALANIVKGKVKKGFKLEGGHCAPIDQAAQHKYETGLDDQLSKTNTKSYPQEIFEVCGLAYNKETYLLDAPPKFTGLPKLARPLVGLNTGCGSRWPTRLWAIENWTSVALQLQKAGYGVVLLGGPEEDDRNKQIAAASGAHYPGYFPLGKFMSLVNEIDLMVTGVTMAQHLAIGFNKKLILFNNIFNRHEFELYGLGEIVEPPGGCTCYFASHCDHPCMPTITVERVLTAIKKHLS